MTKEHFEEANQLYDYMADVEDNLKKLDRINDRLTEDTVMLILAGEMNNDTLKKISDFCIEQCYVRCSIIPKGLESEVIKKTRECLSEELKDCQVEFASL